MIYLASPYTHPDPAVREQRFKDACACTSRLMREGLLVLSPIVSSHLLAVHGGLPGTWDYWEKYDVELMGACEALIVLRLDGWKESVGVKFEIEWMRKNGRKVHFIDQDGEIPRELVESK